MEHIKPKGTRAEQTPTEWLKIGANITALVNEFAMRSDLVAYVGPNAGQSYPACYLPHTAEVEVNVDIAFGRGIKPQHIKDLTIRKNQFEFPRAVGAIFHEALHARYSKWNIEKTFEALERNQQEFDALMLLEESRIEGKGLNQNPNMRPFLRSCAMEIVASDAEEKLTNDLSVGVSAFFVGTVLARVEAGVLEDSEVEPITNLVYENLGTELVSKLIELVQKFQAHPYDANMELTFPIVKEWVRLINEKKKEKGEDASNAKGGSGASDAMKEFVEKVREALEEASGSVAISSNEEVSDAEQEQEWKEIVESRQDKSKTQNESQQVAREVYSSGSGPESVGTRSKLVEARKPNSDERVSAVKISQILERAKYRERDEFEISSVTPPGRLRTRSLVQGAAMKQRGISTPTEAWRRTVRKHTDDPTLSVGIMVDISGSMNPAMQPMASTAWIMSEAVRRVQGKVSMVYFGSAVFPTLRVGERLDEVRVYSAVDNTEEFDRGFKALNGSLTLLNGTGARLLVVVSDANYRQAEYEKARRWIQECSKAGVGVVFIPIHADYHARRLCQGTDAVVLSDSIEPSKVSTEIGKAAGQALQKVAVAS